MLVRLSATEKAAQDTAYPVWFRTAGKVAAYARTSRLGDGTTAIWLLGAGLRHRLLGASTTLQAFVTRVGS